MGRKARYYDVMIYERFEEVVNGFKGETFQEKLLALARRVGCSNTTFIRYVNEYTRVLSPEIVKKIAKATGVSIDWLYGLSDEKYRSKK